MASLLRSRQPIRSGLPGDASLDSTVLPSTSHNDKDSKGNAKSWFCRYRVVLILITSITLWDYIFANDGERTLVQGTVAKAPMGDIIYGAKSKGDDTARLVKEAIQIGFRHIATVCAYANDHETM